MARKKTRKSRKPRGIAAGKSKTKDAVKLESETSKNYENIYMVTIPINVIYSLNTSSIKNSSNYVKEEPSEFTNSSNELLEETDSCLDADMRNLDELSSGSPLELQNRPLENLSPTRTIIKEEFCEPTDMDVKEEPSEIRINSSNELQEEIYSYSDSEMLDLEVQRRPPEIVSPTPTIIMEEFHEFNNTDFNCCANFISDSKNITLLMDKSYQTPHNVSQTEFLMEQDSSQHSRTLPSVIERTASPNQLVNQIEMELMNCPPIAKREQISSSQPIIPRQLMTPRQPKRPIEYMSPRQQISSRESISPRTPIKQPSNSTESINRIQPISPKAAINPRLSSIPTVAPSPCQHMVSDIISPNSAPTCENVRSTGTSIEPEQASSEERVADTASSNSIENTRFKLSLSALIQDERQNLQNPEIAINSNYTPSPERYVYHSPRKYQRRRSNQLSPSLLRKRSNADETVVNSTPVHHLKSLAHTVNQNKQTERKLTSSRKRSYHTESKRMRRSHERVSNDQDSCIEYKHEVKSGKRDRLKPSPSESERKFYEISASPKCNLPQPSISTDQRNNIANIWQSIRFSITPDVSPSDISEQNEDSDSDYGWEDPPPPKSKLDDLTESTLEYMNPNIKEKMEMFNKDLKNQFDLDVIEASKNELFRVFEESIAEQLQKKLIELDLQIKKKKDDYIHQLFGTDNFDDWDDDPALSNVKTTKKLRLCKHLFPSDTGLLEKMNSTSLRDIYHKLTFQGGVKQIENEFQGKELPSDLLDLNKREKKMISDSVIKFLMPYYNEGRIQPGNIFRLVARKIAHTFYEQFADETKIRTYIDDLFKEAGIVTLRELTYMGIT